VTSDEKVAGRVIARVTENLEVRRNGPSRPVPVRGRPRPIRDNSKTLRERGGTSTPGNIGDWKRYIDDQPVFRQFYCPGCGALVENEVARADDPVLRDIEVQLK
jgi:hypothetical protein